MAKQLIREINEYTRLYRDDRTGIAWIEDGSAGVGISIHPNIDASGSVRGMKEQGYWGKNDRTVKSNGFIYNIDHITFSWYEGYHHALEMIVASECRCQGCLERMVDELKEGERI